VDESRIFWHKDDLGPAADNEKTVFVSPAPQPSPPRPHLTIRELFSKHYGGIRAWLAGINGAGVALVAVDDDGVRAAAFLAAKAAAISSAIIGRHTQSDLRLREDASLSLRHLALLLYPRPAAGGRSRFRLLDLRTATAFLDERGRRLRALEADGPAFVRCGRYAVLIFPVNEPVAPWPNEPDEAWEAIPNRLYLDEVETEERSPDWEEQNERAWEVEALPGLSEPLTLVHHVAGPQMAVHELVGDGEPPLGEVRVTSTLGVATIVVGASAARAGVLLGRSRRCDAGRVLADPSISRVHMLIIEISGSLYAIDTASCNGVWDDEERERATLLKHERSLVLSDVATMEWRVPQPDSSQDPSTDPATGSSE